MKIELTAVVITASVICAVTGLALRAYATSHTSPPYETSFEHRVRYAGCFEEELTDEKSRHTFVVAKKILGDHAKRYLTGEK